MVNESRGGAWSMQLRRLFVECPSLLQTASAGGGRPFEWGQQVGWFAVGSQRARPTCNWDCLRQARARGRAPPRRAPPWHGGGSPDRGEEGVGDEEVAGRRGGEGWGSKSKFARDWLPRPVPVGLEKGTGAVLDADSPSECTPGAIAGCLHSGQLTVARGEKRDRQASRQVRQKSWPHWPAAAGATAKQREVRRSGWVGSEARSIEISGVIVHPDVTTQAEKAQAGRGVAGGEHDLDDDASSLRARATQARLYLRRAPHAARRAGTMRRGGSGDRWVLVGAGGGKAQAVALLVLPFPCAHGVPRRSGRGIWHVVRKLTHDWVHQERKANRAFVVGRVSLRHCARRRRRGGGGGFGTLGRSRELLQQRRGLELRCRRSRLARGMEEARERALAAGHGHGDGGDAGAGDVGRSAVCGRKSASGEEQSGRLVRRGPGAERGLCPAWRAGA
eukprot:353225-Chlamydomonas_euryale.AAC.4